MTQWKKVVSVALAVVMSLAVLTGCSSGGGSVGGTTYPAVTPSVYDEKAITGYVKDYVSEKCSITLTEASSEVRDAVYSVLPQAVVCIDHGLDGNYNSNELENVMNTLDKKMTALGKHGCGQIQALAAIYDKDDIYKWLDGDQNNPGLSSYIERLISSGYTPTVISVAATTKYRGVVGTNVVYVIVTIMD